MSSNGGRRLPVLANLLVNVDAAGVALTGTDLEVEMVARTEADDLDPGEVTVPARKLFDICRALPDGVHDQVRADRRARDRQRGPQPLHAGDAAGDRVSGHREHRAGRARLAARGDAEIADGAHQLRDGAPGRALLPQRHAARSARAFAALRRDRRASPGAGRNEARQQDLGEPPDHRAAQGRHRVAGPVRNRRRHGRARVRAQSSARAARRRHVHLEADRRPFPGLRSRRSDRRRQGSAREPRRAARGAAARGDPVEREIPRREARSQPEPAAHRCAQSGAGRGRRGSRGEDRRRRISASASTSITCSMRSAR